MIRHTQQDTATLTGDAWRVVVPSDSGKRHYVVCLVRSASSADQVDTCNCPASRYRRTSCKHIRRARDLVRRRQAEAAELVEELKQASTLADWSRQQFAEQIAQNLHIHKGDLFAAGRAVERRLFFRGVKWQNDQ